MEYQEKRKAILLRENKEKTIANYLVLFGDEFVVCSNWNGKDWDWGHYFKDYQEAKKFLYSENTDKDLKREQNKVLKSFETRENLYDTLFYSEYAMIDIKDIISEYVYLLEENISPVNLEEIQNRVASSIKRGLIG